MPLRHFRILFIMALAASLLVHAMLFVLTGIAMARSERMLDVDRTDVVTLVLPPEPEPPPPPLPPPPPPQPPELQLGIDADTPPSETWLGFEKPEPQFAPPSIVEQAAFTQEPIAAAAQEAAAPPSVEPIAPSMETVQPPDQHSDPSPPIELPQPLKIDEPESAKAEPLVQPQPSDASLDSLLDSPPLDLLSFADWLESIRPERTEDENPANKSPSPEKKTQPNEAQQTPRAEPSEPKPDHKPDQPIAPHAVKGAPNDGVQSDKDSAASSIIEVPREQWQKGKPIAAHGLELKPQRPEFTVLTMLTAAPGNPLCLIKFGRNGVPVHADLVESSGDTRVDEALRASLYRWRASGKELDRLAKDETANVTMRIILNRNRSS